MLVTCTTMHLGTNDILDGDSSLVCELLKVGVQCQVIMLGLDVCR